MSNIVYKSGWIHLPTEVNDSTVVPEDIPVDGPLKFDFKALRNLNSYGLRLLIKIFRSRTGQPLEFYNCPAHFVEMANVVRDLLGPARDGRVIKSLELVHACDQCNRSTTAFFETQKLSRDLDGFGIPLPTCDKCGDPMELAVDESTYLGFLTE